MNCPNDLNHKQAHHQSENQIHNFHHAIKAGFFYRNSDKQQLQRFKCKSCKIYFSTETYSLCKYQKKREINNMVFHLLLSSVSQRRCAQIHTAAMLRANINRLVRKTWCTTKHPERLSYHLAIYTIYHNFILLDLEPNKTFNLCQMQV